MHGGQLTNDTTLFCSAKITTGSNVYQSAVLHIYTRAFQLAPWSMLGSNALERSISGCCVEMMMSAEPNDQQRLQRGAVHAKPLLIP